MKWKPSDSIFPPTTAINQEAGGTYHQARALPVPPHPSEWLWQLVVYRSCVLMQCHHSRPTCGSHSSVLNVGQGRSHSLTIWPLNLFSYLRTSWLERCRLVRLLYSTGHMTFVWRDVKSSCQFEEFYLCTSQSGAGRVEQPRLSGAERHTQTRWTVFTSDYLPLSSYLLLTLT